MQRRPERARTHAGCNSATWLEQREVLTVVRRVAKAMAAVTCRREAFEVYCKESYGGFSDESGGACPSLVLALALAHIVSGCPNGPRYISIEKSAACPMVHFLQKARHSIEWHAF